MCSMSAMVKTLSINGGIMKDKIKETITTILYLDSTDEIRDRTQLFTELGLSSIDYIDLCFELKQQFGKEVGQDDLWPINKMLRNKSYYDKNQWTDVGWERVCATLKLDSTSEKIPIQKLYEFFTVDYIENRLRELV